MRHYLSFGGGVNSVALHLLMLKEKMKFEAIFVHHGTDWPETYDYLAGFQNWLKWNGHKPITILRPSKFPTLLAYCEKLRIIPYRIRRWCTSEFKIKPLIRYVERPCFQHLGIDAGEAKRAKLSSEGGIEHRFLLIEYGIDRDGCKDIIRKHGLPVPMKSGCYICPFQRIGQWKQLRRDHPCLFQRAVDLENSAMDKRKSKNKRACALNGDKTLPQVVNENQMQIFEEDEYPPCQCGL